MTTLLPKKKRILRNPLFLDFFSPILQTFLKEEFFDTYTKAMTASSEMIIQEEKKQRESMNMRLAQIEREVKKIRKGYIDEVFSADEAREMKSILEIEKVELMKRLKADSEALNFAYFKIAQHFLETFKSLSSKYKRASSQIKREILELFFSKYTIEDEILVLNPTPIMEQVSILSKSVYGRGDMPYLEILEKIFEENRETFNAFQKGFIGFYTQWEKDPKYKTERLANGNSGDSNYKTL